MVKKIALIYFLLDFILIVFSLFFGKNFLISSQVAFFCSVLIFLTSARAYKSKIYNELYNTNFDKNGEYSKKNLSFTFFSPLKILAYIFFGICFFGLQKINILNPFAFLIGTTLMPIGMVIYGVLIDK